MTENTVNGTELPKFQLTRQEGVHPRVVMEVLGHAQMRTTTDTYSHVMPALGRDAADRMSRALWD